MKKIACIFILATLLFSCSNSDPICACFETRLALKELVNAKEGEDVFELLNDEEYKELKKHKDLCVAEIEPAYFEKMDISRASKSDKEFLLDELSDCEAVKELMQE